MAQAFVQHTINTSAVSALLYCSGTVWRWERVRDSHNGSGNCPLRRILCWWPGDTNVAAIKDSNDIRMERVEHAGLEEEGWLGGGIGAYMRSICEVGCGVGGWGGDWSLCTGDNYPPAAPRDSRQACDFPFQELLQSQRLRVNREGGASHRTFGM